jgi:hypothetical protein
VDSLSLPDLVASKKAQRDKYWPTIRRLVEVSYDKNFADPTPEQVEFWLREFRTPELLVDCARWFPDDAGRLVAERQAIEAALSPDLDAVRAALAAEESRERALDRAYWDPLKAELQALRHQRKRPR